MLLSVPEKKGYCHKVEVLVDAPTRRGCSINSVINLPKYYAIAMRKNNPPPIYELQLRSKVLNDSERFPHKSRRQRSRRCKEKPPESDAMSARYAAGHPKTDE